MKPENICELEAKRALEQYVNGCHCMSVHEAVLAVQKMIAVANHAIDLLQTGQIEPVQ